jgi:cytochrome c biogenesis protein CcdA
VFYLFYSLTCARCRDARDYLEELRSAYRDVEFRELEVQKSRENQEIFTRLAGELDIRTPGVPVFIFGKSYRVGFKEGDEAKEEIRRMIERELGNFRPETPKTEGPRVAEPQPPGSRPPEPQPPGSRPPEPQPPGFPLSDSQVPPLRLPFVGALDARSLSLPAFTVFIGLLDGVNPCALWVLMLLLSLLASAGSRGRMIVVGAVFIFFSAGLYFAFMAAWFSFFEFLKLKSAATLVLGIGVCILGIVNAKELFWFKKGFSLVIPERAKPRIFDGMRKVVSSPNGFLLVASTAVLAFLVNLAEFGCTVGLPAVYTRVLSLQETDIAGKYLFMAFYNAVYVLPLAAVLAAFVLTFGRFRLMERHGRILKIVTGLVMLVLGILLVFRPGYLLFA